MNRMGLNMDSLALLLFCCQLHSYKEVPLSMEEWDTLEKAIRIHGLKGPADVLAMEYQEFVDVLGMNDFCAYKMTKRIQTMAFFAKQINDLEANGIYVTTKYEKSFPENLVKRLKKRAPLYLFYVGDITLVETGISISGLTEPSKKELRYTKRIVDKIMEEKKTYISNDTKGTDYTAFRHALYHGGKVVCFVSDNLLSKKREYKRYLKSKQLVMLSAVDPKSPFNVTHAIDRNSYVCGISKYHIIVASHINNGATWFTALQNMHHHWTVPLVLDNGCIGNSRLLDMGAVPLYIKDILSDSSYDMMYEKNKIHVLEEQVNVDQMSIFEFIGEVNGFGKMDETD